MESYRVCRYSRAFFSETFSFEDRILDGFVVPSESPAGEKYIERDSRFLTDEHILYTDRDAASSDISSSRICAVASPTWSYAYWAWSGREDDVYGK